MKKKVKNTRTVKGYVLLGERGEVVETLAEDRDVAYHEWEHEFEDLGFSIVPCKITYTT